jgi:hypothetical protein
VTGVYFRREEIKIMVGPVTRTNPAAPIAVPKALQDDFVRKYKKLNDDIAGLHDHPDYAQRIPADLLAVNENLAEQFHQAQLASKFEDLRGKLFAQLQSNFERKGDLEGSFIVAGAYDPIRHAGSADFRTVIMLALSQNTNKDKSRTEALTRQDEANRLSAQASKLEVEAEVLQDAVQRLRTDAKILRSEQSPQTQLTAHEEVARDEVDVADRVALLHKPDESYVQLMGEGVGHFIVDGWGDLEDLRKRLLESQDPSNHEIGLQLDKLLQGQK